MDSASSMGSLLAAAGLGRGGPGGGLRAEGQAVAHMNGGGMGALFQVRGPCRTAVLPVLLSRSLYCFYCLWTGGAEVQAAVQALLPCTP